MATDLNTVVLIGRFTRDPEYKIVNEGSSLVNFSVANNRTYVVNGVKKEETHFFDCVAWGKLAEIIKQYGSKGKQVLVEGRLVQETWDTPDGKKASKVKIRTENIQLLGSRGGTQDDSTEVSVSSYATKTGPTPVEDVIGEIDSEDIF
jgi:single-strand DNA-binding protein